MFGLMTFLLTTVLHNYKSHPRYQILSKLKQEAYQQVLIRQLICLHSMHALHSLKNMHESLIANS